MDLCLSLGCTLEELGERMSVAEFNQWLAGWVRGIWGRNRADLRAGIVAATVANYAGKVRKDEAGPANPADYLPADPFAAPKPQVQGPSPAEFVAMLKGKK